MKRNTHSLELYTLYQNLAPVLVCADLGNLLSNNMDWFALVSRNMVIGVMLSNPGACMNPLEMKGVYSSTALYNLHTVLDSATGKGMQTCTVVIVGSGGPEVVFFRCQQSANKYPLFLQ